MDPVVLVDQYHLSHPEDPVVLVDLVDQRSDQNQPSLHHSKHINVRLQLRYKHHHLMHHQEDYPLSLQFQELEYQNLQDLVDPVDPVVLEDLLHLAFLVRLVDLEDLEVLRYPDHLVVLVDQ